MHTEQGLPIGEPLPDWQSPPPPSREAVQGHYCRLAKLMGEIWLKR